MDKPCTSTVDGTWSCAITRSGGYQGLAVWNSLRSLSYPPDAVYVDYRDLAGNSVKISSGMPVTIGQKPILFENTPPTQSSP
jgi:hypothetical protein